MPAIHPPAALPGSPFYEDLPSGSRLLRIHSLNRPPLAFTTLERRPPQLGRPVTGGRFDSPDGAYAYLYAAMTDVGAFAESFGRDLDYAKAGPRPLPRVRVAGKVISTIEVVRPIRLVVIHGAGAQQLGQDDWLTRCDEDGYPTCREWANAIRLWIPQADGLTWRSKRDPDEKVLMMWGDPHAAETGCGMLGSADPANDPIETGLARARLDAFLLRWRLYLEP